MQITPTEATIAGTLVAGFFTAAGAFAVQVFGKPEDRMKHRENIETIESTEATALAEANARATSSVVTALSQRCEAMEANIATLHTLLSQQAQKTDLLSSTNAKLVERINQLKSRVAQLEEQAALDKATIADLQTQLEAARAELATAQAEIERWAEQCGACSEAKSKTKAQGKAASKKGGQR